jgi:FrmR/RcnR family transcriptional regulator, repressor of frmRAB operon
MVHTVRDRSKLLNRVRRIRGQVVAIEELLEKDAECERVLHTIAACRGAIDGLLAEVLEDHIRYHVISPSSNPDSEQVQAAEELVDLLRTYLK